MRSQSESEPTRMPTTVSGMGDVPTELHADEIYARSAFICGGSRLCDGLAACSDVEDAAAVRHEAAVVQRGARMEDECTGCLGSGDSLDRRAGVVPRRVVPAGQH